MNAMNVCVDVREYPNIIEQMMMTKVHMYNGVYMNPIMGVGDG